MAMKKLILLFTLLLVPTICLAVGYQVSCRLTYHDTEEGRSRFKAALNYLSGIESIGTAGKFHDMGDFLRPLLDDPNQAAVPQITIKYRMADPNARDIIYDYILGEEAYVDPNVYGYILYHDCYGDEQKSCPPDTGETWGGGE